MIRENKNIINKNILTKKAVEGHTNRNDTERIQHTHTPKKLIQKKKTTFTTAHKNICDNDII